jgi:hypothetical protein
MPAIRLLLVLIINHRHPQNDSEAGGRKNIFDKKLKLTTANVWGFIGLFTHTLLRAISRRDKNHPVPPTRLKWLKN